MNYLLLTVLLLIMDSLVLNKLENDNIVVTQIPDYPNSLCYAGKQYCQAYNIPKFTDYTIITRRAIFKFKWFFWSY